MEPKDNGPAADKPTLTPREIELLVAAFLSLNEVKLDMTKFIKYSGFANANSATANWARVKKKILDMGGDDGLNMATTVTPRAVTAKRKTKGAAHPGDDAESGASPAKKSRVASKKTKVAAPAVATASEKLVKETSAEMMEDNGDGI